MTDTPGRRTQVPDLLGRMAWVASRGAIMDGDRRYLMLRADALMGIFRELPPDVRRPAMEAFAASIRKHGGRSAQAYFDEQGARPEALIETITAYSPALGWGSWQIAARTAEGFDVTVESSPFAEGFGHSSDPVCHPIVGMLQAVGAIVYGQPVMVVETACAAQSGIDRCRFRVALTAPA